MMTSSLLPKLAYSRTVKLLNEDGNLMGNVSASLYLDGTFSDIFDHEKLAHPAESTPSA